MSNLQVISRKTLSFIARTTAAKKTGGYPSFPRIFGARYRLCSGYLIRTGSYVDFERDPYLWDIVERNLAVVAQCCLDNRVISLEDLDKPHDYYGAFIALGQTGILPLKSARSLAGIAGFRNILPGAVGTIKPDQPSPLAPRKAKRHSFLK